MKPYSQIFTSIDQEFDTALRNFTSDPLFASAQTIYTDDDKKRISLLWGAVLSPFLQARHIIRKLYWRSFFTLGSKNSFVVKYTAIVTYYNMLCELQQSFGPHEEFLRQYLDDVFSENYSTLARYMYHVRFLAVLSYPHEYFLTLRDEVDPSLSSLFDRPQKYAGQMKKRWTHDLVNIWYYVRYRISLFLTWIAKHFGRIMMRIRVKYRKYSLLSPENIRAVQELMKPGDILLTRQNWVATNLNIPGFWKHMAMYIGTGKYLKEKYRIKTKRALQDDVHYIIEAIGAGVQIIPLDTLCSHNDYLGVLRPKFQEEKVERAVAKTVKLNGKSYDYSFNYYSDVNYVCSTLVTKSYLPESRDDEGLHITLTRIGTGITYPPNDIVKKYHDDLGNNQSELDFVAFVDSVDRTGKNFLSSEEAFRLSGFRPKLSFFLP